MERERGMEGGRRECGRGEGRGGREKQLARERRKGKRDGGRRESGREVM